MRTGCQRNVYWLATNHLSARGLCSQSTSCRLRLCAGRDCALSRQLANEKVVNSLNACEPLRRRRRRRRTIATTATTMMMMAINSTQATTTIVEMSASDDGRWIPGAATARQNQMKCNDGSYIITK